MLENIKEVLFNTPKRYWLVIFGYHIHKSFWGVLFILLGIIMLRFYSLSYGVLLIIIGFILIILDVWGHIYTNNKPYFKLLERKH